MRAVLFTDVPGLRRLSVRMRQPGNFYAKFEPGYWITSVRFTPPSRLRPNPGFDPLLGWVGQRIEPGTYAHRGETLLLERRPVLLYGDSFAQCVVDPGECWEGLLAKSELGRTHLLLNYGVGGYGFDQTYLLMRSSVDRFADRNPVVIVSLLVEDDLDRALLPFRGWPKPVFGLEDGALIEPEPVRESVEDFLEHETPVVWSWAWRYLLNGTNLLPETWRADPEANQARVREMARALLVATKKHLDERNLEWFVLVFQGKVVTSKVWQHAFLTDTLRELEIPFVTSRRPMLEHWNEHKLDQKLYFFQEGNDKGHYTALGNEAVFPAILRGLRHEFE